MDTVKNFSADSKMSDEKCTCETPENCPKRGSIVVNGENRICSKYFSYIKFLEQQQKIEEVVPRSFWEKDFDNFEAYTPDLEKAKERSMKFAQKKAWQQGSGFCLLGRYGVGKTHLASAIGKMAITNGSQIGFITSSKLRGTQGEIIKKVEALQNIELIIIDDLSREVLDRNVITELFNLINYRYEQKLGYIITSNYLLRSKNDSKALVDIVGERIFDRLMERSVFIQITDAESYREKKRNEFTSWIND